MGKAGNRRRNKREKKRLKVRFWNDELDASGFTADVSETGLFLATSHNLSIGTRLHLEIELPDGPYMAEGMVVRRKTYPQYARGMYKSGVGVRLIGLGGALGLAGGYEESEEEEAPEHEVEETPVEESLCVDLRDFEELRETYERDLKHGGLLVHTAECPDLDSEVVVAVLLPEPHGQMECVGTVVKHNDSPPGIALRLDDVDRVRARVLEVIRSA